MLFSLIVGSLFSLVFCVWCVCCRKRKKKVDARNQVTYSEEKKSLEKVKSYEKLTNLDDAESTKTDSSASSKDTKTVSIISDGSHDTLESNASYILVQPIQHAEPFSLDGKGNHATHSLAQLKLIPAYHHPFYPKAGSETEHTNVTKFKSQMEANNLLPAVAYRPPSPATLDSSMKMISKLIELNSRNLAGNHNFAINHQQKDRSTNEFTVDQRRARLSVQSSHDSFD